MAPVLYSIELLGAHISGAFKRNLCGAFLQQCKKNIIQFVEIPFKKGGQAKFIRVTTAQH